MTSTPVALPAPGAAPRASVVGRALAGLAGVGATLLRLRADPAFVPASFGAGGRMDIGPLDRDFASPGGELSLAIEQRVRGGVGMRVRGALMAVRNDTEGMDGGTTFPGQPYGKSAQWTRAVPVTLGVTVHL